jgi:hypothetical protein
VVDEIAQLEAALPARLTVKGSRGQPVAHPLLGELRMHRVVLRALVKQLSLPDPVDRPVHKVKSGGKLVAVRRLQRRDA